MLRPATWGLKSRRPFETARPTEISTVVVLVFMKVKSLAVYQAGPGLHYRVVTGPEVGSQAICVWDARNGGQLQVRRDLLLHPT
jgi:hypothetical protein